MYMKASPLFKKKASWLWAVPAALVVYLGISAFTKQTDPGTPPDPNRFTKVVLTEAGKLDEPMEMTFLPDGRVLIVERKGGLKAVDSKTGAVKLLATIPVNTKYKNKTLLLWCK